MPDLNPVQFFHGSSHEFKPGDVIQPAATTGVTSRGGEDRVWVSKDAWQASKYGAHVYPVTPHDPPKQPRRDWPEAHTSGATVTGPPVDNAVILEHANARYAPKKRSRRA